MSSRKKLTRDEQIAMYFEAQFKDIAKESEVELKKYYKTDDVKVKLGSSGLRSIEKQLEYLKSGASDTKLSLHQFGHAADFEIFIDGEHITGTQKTKEFKYSTEPYRVLGGVAKRKGYFWGWQIDSGHVATHEYVSDLLEDRPSLASNKFTLNFYSQYEESAPNKLKDVLTKLDKLYKVESNRTWYGEEREDRPMYEPIYVNNIESKLISSLTGAGEE